MFVWRSPFDIINITRYNSKQYCHTHNTLQLGFSAKMKVWKHEDENTLFIIYLGQRYAIVKEKQYFCPYK
jgi:hypothetical protein